MSIEALAWYMYPEPEGKSYSKDEFENPEIVREVFDYCQINLAAIFENGWQYLFTKYSLQELAEIDKASGWFQPCSINEFEESIEYYALIAGYNPRTKQFGIYNEKTGEFEPKS